MGARVVSRTARGGVQAGEGWFRPLVWAPLALVGSCLGLLFLVVPDEDDYELWGVSIEVEAEAQLVWTIVSESLARRGVEAPPFDRIRSPRAIIREEDVFYYVDLFPEWTPCAVYVWTRPSWSSGCGPIMDGIVRDLEAAGLRVHRDS